jgi:bla regulator protein BlaR1
MSAAVREALPLHEGREVKALRRVEQAGGIRKRIEIFLSRASVEPGIFGIARPVLMWPEGISPRLDDAHVEAILAHEVGHVRRRDNLFAAIHMLVEAIFWFHPLVWFLGTRLVEEREVACDEGVLELGSKRQVYAESILKICEFCVGSPLACVSGVTGADLKKRIIRIMTSGSACRLNLSKRLMLGAAGLLAIAAPVVFGLAHASSNRNQTQDTGTVRNDFKFEVASIKQVKSDIDSFGRTGVTNAPDGFRATSAPVKLLIQQAYGVESYQISGVPDWLNSELYDVDAKMEASVADALQKLGPNERTVARQRMLQELLADRLKLTIRRESKELQIYALVIAKNGPNLKEEKPSDSGPNNSTGNIPVGTGTVSGGGRGGPLIGHGVPVPNLARLLTAIIRRPVIDQTGLTGKYNFTLQWTPDDSQLADSGGIQESTAPDPNGRPNLFTAIQEQLGLKLESRKGPVEMIVIDHVERPSGN